MNVGDLSKDNKLQETHDENKISVHSLKTDVLDKVNRKINLDQQIKDWSSKTNKDIYDWIKLIRKIDD